MDRIDVKTCQKHKTPEQKAREDHRSLLEKRHFLEIGDIVYATSKYRKTMSIKLEDKDPDFDGGKIVKFKDPYDWDGNKAHSQAYIEMPCGCVLFYSTLWLRK